METYFLLGGLFCSAGPDPSVRSETRLEGPADPEENPVAVGVGVDGFDEIEEPVAHLRAHHRRQIAAICCGEGSALGIFLVEIEEFLIGIRDVEAYGGDRAERALPG